MGRSPYLYRRAQATVRRTGNAVMDAFYVFNIGEIVLEQGHLDAAEESFEAAWRAWRAAGYRSGVADVKGKLARVAACRGRYDDALALLAESVDEFRHIGSQADALEAQARVTECLLLRGDHRQALGAADQALAQARALGGVPPQIALLQRVRGAALWLAGNRPAAEEALGQSLTAARKRRAEYEAALTLRVMAEVVEVGERDRRGELLDSASATLAKLGVVATPDLLHPPPAERSSPFPPP